MPSGGRVSVRCEARGRLRCHAESSRYALRGEGGTRRAARIGTIEVDVVEASVQADGPHGNADIEPAFECILRTYRRRRRRRSMLALACYCTRRQCDARRSATPRPAEYDRDRVASGGIGSGLRRRHTSVVRRNFGPVACPLFTCSFVGPNNRAPCSTRSPRHAASVSRLVRHPHRHGDCGPIGGRRRSHCSQVGAGSRRGNFGSFFSSVGSPNLKYCTMSKKQEKGTVGIITTW